MSSYTRYASVGARLPVRSGRTHEGVEMSEHLFSQGQLREDLQATRAAALAHLLEMDHEKLLSTPDADVVEYLAVAATAACPILDRDGIEVLPVREVELPATSWPSGRSITRRVAQ